MIADMPRKRTLAAMLLIGGVAGLGAGAIDRARGTSSSAALIFLEHPAGFLPSRTGHPAAAPAPSTQGAAAFQEISAK
jgi:hypothetical protein